MTDPFPPVEPGQFRAAMRLPATSVAVIATGQAGARNGLTASAVCSLSDTPPMILVCVNLNSHVLPHIRSCAAFSASFLTSAQQDLAERFAGRHGVYGEERFADAGWTTLATGMPVLGDALASFDCTLEAEHDSPTHAILIGRVKGLIRNEDRTGLIYASGLFGQPAWARTAAE